MCDLIDFSDWTTNQGIVKYIALLAMVKIVPTHPHLVAEHQNTILSSVDDDDISIRMRALDLLLALVSNLHTSSLVFNSYSAGQSR